jgi:hypothetical protein
MFETITVRLGVYGDPEPPKYFIAAWTIVSRKTLKRLDDSISSAKVSEYSP